ncbi:MAG: CARDB domain-containing protein, partial [Bacteroidota bacterium]
FRAVGDAQCSATTSVAAPQPCSNSNGDLPDLSLANLNNLPAFAKQAAVVNFEFDLINSGSAAVNGDYIVGAILSTDSNIGNVDDVEVGVVNTGNTPVGTIADVQAAITIPADLAPGAYFLILLADTNNVITESNESNNFLSANITIEANDPGEGVDISLAAAASNNTPPQWTFFSIELVVSNEGSESASGVQVQIPVVDGIKLKGGDEFDATQGSFQAYGNRKWNVGSLPAGQSATIVLNYFNTTTSPVSVFAQLTDLAEADTDSTPDNNTSGTPTEDDEVAVLLNAAASNRGRSLAAPGLETQVLDFRILKVYPSLTANDTRIVLNS